MRRNLLIVALGLGVVLGFGSGFAHLHRCRHGGHAGTCCVGHPHRHPLQDSPPPAAP